MLRGYISSVLEYGTKQHDVPLLVRATERTVLTSLRTCSFIVTQQVAGSPVRHMVATDIAKSIHKHFTTSEVYFCPAVGADDVKPLFRVSRGLARFRCCAFQGVMRHQSLDDLVVGRFVSWLYSIRTGGSCKLTGKTWFLSALRKREVTWLCVGVWAGSSA
jgi:hypothetical protein